MQRHVHNHFPCLFCQYLQTEVKGVTNVWHLIGRLNQPAADGFLPLRAFKPSSSDSAVRGRSIIQATANKDIPFKTPPFYLQCKYAIFLLQPH